MPSSIKCCRMCCRNSCCVIAAVLVVLELCQLRLLPVDMNGLISLQTLREEALFGSPLNPWSLPHEIPGHLWRNYGDGDYELHVARRFLQDYTRYRTIDPPVAMVPSFLTRVRCRTLAGCPLRVADNPTCWSPQCGRIAAYNDEVYHGTARTPQAPTGSVYIEGARDQDWGEICRAYECINVTVAAMSFYLRPSDAEAMLRSPRPTSLWARRSHFCSFLYLHQRADRVKFRDVLANRSGIVIPQLHGTGRNSLDIFEEAVLMQRDYRFSIAFESSQDHRYYVTEKIVNAFLAGTIPIYWGNLNIHEYFNPRAFINVASFASFQDAADHVIGKRLFFIHACIHTHTHTHTHTHIHTYIYIHTYIHTCIHTYMHACIHTCIHRYIHEYIRTYIHT